MIRRGFSPFACLFTRADTSPTTGTRFFPFTTPRSTADIKAVHAMMDVLNMTGDTRLQFGFIESDETEIFAGPATVIDSNFARTADGFDGTAGYQAVTFTKANAVFGVITRNNSAGTPKIELCWVSARFDTRAC